MVLPLPLPIDPLLPELVARVAAGNLVLVAPPGAGKTSRVPPALLAGGVAGEAGRILLLEPRRIAARAAARRIAEEQGWRLGEEVGYQVRFERVAGPRTRLLAVTEGVLVRLLQADPFLAGVAVVLFDEAHERSLELDLALAMARRVQRQARPDLRLVAMSATLDPGPLAAHLAAPVVVAEARAHPVEVRYLQRPDDRALPALAAWAVRRMLAESAGGVLVFLPGAGEIERTARALAEGARDKGALDGGALDDGAELDLPVLPLHGSLGDREQDAALAATPRRRVVLATNLAETSLTVPGVTAVVDGGLARQLRLDAGCGLDRLELVRISRAAAEQRAGRAGREGPGVCLRLWTAAEHAALPARETPELARVDLSGAVLQLRAWGEGDLAAFPWLEAPAADALQRADDLLRRLGALDERGVTPLGAAMARLPLPPRLARLVVEGHRQGQLAGAARLAALLAERDPFRRERGAPPPPPCPSDALARLDALARFASGRGSDGGGYGALSAGAARRLLAAGDQVATLATRELGAAPSPAGDAVEGLSRALLAGFPDRLARRRAPGDGRAVMVGGRGVRLGDESGVVRPELLLCLDLDAGRRGERAEARVRVASGIEPQWLDGERLRREEVLSYDATRDRVVAVRRLRYEDLAIAESEVPVNDETAAAEALAAAARLDLARAIPLAAGPLADWLARVGALRGWMPELALPTLEGDQLGALLPVLARGRRSLAELRAAPWLASVRGLLTAAQLAAVEREAPERLAVPSGSHLALRYEPGRPPVLAARIQELFGLRETPRVAGGRVPVLLHLLAPNHRPQQVTDDLASFWRHGYPQVRKELRARYPRHAWPEDPLAAAPERRPRRRHE